MRAPVPHPHTATRRTFLNQYQSTYLSLGRRHGLDVKYGAQQVVDDLVLALLTSRLDLLDLGLSLLVRLLLGLLVSLGVLEPFARTVSRAPSYGYVHRGRAGRRTPLCVLWDYVRTSASNFLYSSSLDARYWSISFLASSRASLTRFVLYSRAVASTGLGQLRSLLWVLSSGLLLGLSYTSGRSWRHLSRPVVSVSQTCTQRT